MSKEIGLFKNTQANQKQRKSKIFNIFCALVLFVPVFMAGCQKDSSSGTVPPSSLSSNTISDAAKADIDAAAVNLGTAGNFTILTETGISTTGVTSITGNIGVSPISSTAITGFGLIKDASNQFSKSSL
ncbi:MAG TPA: ice-binding family protein, partial [Mucilaginibacter sp.]|nr:ice-binding family protein [Mucilaginibacter sp.]